VRNTFILLLLLVATASEAQTKLDTFGIMQYNLLYYRASSTQCTGTNNNPNSKDNYLTTILGYAKPGIFVANEIGADGTGLNAKKILDNALNKNGVDYYKMCNYGGNSSLCNMLYYDSRYFAKASQDKIERNINGTFIVRQIDVYRLYFLDQSELDAGDTTFLTFYVAHLKAGSSSADKTQRDNATAAAMKYHEEHYGSDNYFFAGDFNVQSSSEDSYQNLINYSTSSVRFKDPKNRNASWNNNSLYSDLHTQSTRSSSSSGGCFSTGGLDDRFDFILCGDEVLDNTRGVKYIDGSYKALGNDANHFNKAIIDNSNTSVPGTVLSALYNMSDHLPVYMKVGITRTTAGIEDDFQKNNLVVINPIKNQLVFNWTGNESIKKIAVYNAQGSLVKEKKSALVKGWNTLPVVEFTNGVYTMVLQLEGGSAIVRKIVKAN
jgi:hypothetical protein